MGLSSSFLLPDAEFHTAATARPEMGAVTVRVGAVGCDPKNELRNAVGGTIKLDEARTNFDEARKQAALALTMTKHSAGPCGATLYKYTLHFK